MRLKGNFAVTVYSSFYVCLSGQVQPNPTDHANPSALDRAALLQQADLLEAAAWKLINGTSESSEEPMRQPGGPAENH